jgi:hypothetical protein
MFFNKDTKKCKNCSSKILERDSYCAHCGYPQNPEKKHKAYGLLGTDDYSDSFETEEESFGITDKIINSMVNSLMKSLDKQFSDFEKENMKKAQEDLQNAEIQNLPNGIRIKISPHAFNQRVKQKTKKKSILEKAPSESQIERLSSLPKSKAKSSMKRFSDSINYELSTPGVLSTEDIFISKLEEGYEIKAIGSKKVYTSTLPINLPLKRLSLLNNKLLVEFKTDEN